MITFVGAGPGAEDLITVRGQRLLKEADIVIYAGSLVNPGLLKLCKEECEIYNSAKMTLEEVLEVMVKGYGDGKEIVRLHTGDPCLYGAIREQMDELKKLEIPYEDCPGVSSFCGAAAALEAEYTLPGDLSVCRDHENGGKDTSAGERVSQKLCGTSGDDGFILEHRTVKGTFSRIDRRRIQRRYTGSDCL